MPKHQLLDEVREVLRIKNYSYRTEKSYIRWICKFVLFHNKRIRETWPSRKSSSS